MTDFTQCEWIPLLNFYVADTRLRNKNSEGKGVQWNILRD